jgi:hypothetical protein
VSVVPSSAKQAFDSFLCSSMAQLYYLGMLRLGRISRTFSVEVHDNVDHNKPRKLFKDIYRAYLPEINILTKTEKTETVKRENSALVRRRAQREERMKKLQQPRSIKTS